jgi:hypothetical protein
VLRKLNCHSLPDLVRYAMSQGISGEVSPPA